VTNVVPFRAASLSLARTSLDDACSDLDDAVRCLAEHDDDTVMANAELVALLVRVVGARRHLDDVERAPDRLATPSHALPNVAAPSHAPPASLR
jgi:hypothetical protein